MAIREKGKLSDLGMVFKPSFKFFKNEKNYLYSSNSKTRILFYLILYSQSDSDSKKNWSNSLKNMPNIKTKNKFNKFYLIFI